MASSRISTIAGHLKTPSKHGFQPNMVAKVFQLIPGVQYYDWGIQGASSRVAQFAAATKELHFQPENNKPYAELWMGTHPSLPSRAILDSGNEELSSYLAAHPELIGKKVADKFSDEKPGCLPFLFKVLSVGKALSIQAHPDKALGKRLHEARPDVYKDPNHKPEMAIALTSFRGFCGFRPLQEIVGFIKTIPEFAQLVNLSDAELQRASSATDQEEIKSILKTIFSNLMNSPPSTYSPLADHLSRRLSTPDPLQTLPESERHLILNLSSQFPSDIGIFCTFLLNITYLDPGQALFLQANEPHAYLQGEILECMASSDNVVRAGLTPKLRDTDTLVEMCTYQSGSERGSLTAKVWGQGGRRVWGDVEALIYDPPIEEFSVVMVRVRAGGRGGCAGMAGPSIVLVLEGEVEMGEGEGEGEGGLRLVKGQLAFVGAGVAVKLKNVGEGEVSLARAFVEA